MTIAASYATLAARGKYCEPTPIASITTSDGKVIAVPPATCKQVVRADIADGVNQLLQGPLADRRGTARGAVGRERSAGGRQDRDDEQPQPVVVRRLHPAARRLRVGRQRQGRPAPTASSTTLNGKCFGEYGCKRSVFGGTIAAPVWGEIMKAATTGLPVVHVHAALAGGPQRQLRPAPGRHRQQRQHGHREARGRRLQGQGRSPRRQHDRGGPGRPDQPRRTAPPKGGTVTLLISRGYESTPVTPARTTAQPRATHRAARTHEPTPEQTTTRPRRAATAQGQARPSRPKRLR